MLFGSQSAGDSKWRGSIERALASWDSVVEWADYIAFLSRLQKAIKAKAGSGVEMPLSAQVSEHLARCLDPGLPAGVHQTTLQVYETVFTSLSRTQLEREINLWLPGILPLVSYAAFNVKPKVIEFLDNHILSALWLRELCKPLLLATLPSIDDETSECFEDIINLIQKLKDKVGDDVLMWQCLSQCVISSSECRLGALSYFSRYLPSLAQIEDNSARVVISPEPGIFIRGLCCGLSDPNVLVQRGFLDILVKNVPVSSPALSKCPPEDFKSLLYTACSTIARKDMSLNRRLWSWLLGPDPDITDNEHMTRAEYFKRYGATALVDVLKEKISSSDPQQLSQICVIVHGLMDRWELASIVIPRILVPILKQVQILPDALPASMQLFDGVESDLIWKCALDMILENDIDVVQFMVDKYNIHEEEMLGVHIPNVLVVCTKLLKDGDDTKGLAHLTGTLLKQISLDPLKETDISDQITTIEDFYASERDDQLEVEPLPMVSYWITMNLVDYYCQTENCLGGPSDLLSLVFEKLPEGAIRLDKLVKKLLQPSEPDPQVFAQICSTMSFLEKSTWVHSATRYYFDRLATPGAPQVEIVNDIWTIYTTVEGYLTPSALAQCFNNTDSLRAGRAFCGLWIHTYERQNHEQLVTKPLLLLLDRMSSEMEIVRLFLRTAVVNTNSADRLLKILMDKISSFAQDPRLLEYFLRLLNKLVFEADIKVIKKAYLSQFSKGFIDDFKTKASSSSTECYAQSLSIIENSVLDSDEKIFGTSTLMELLSTLIQESPKLNPYLLRFVSVMLPHLNFQKRVTFGNEQSLEFQLFSLLSNNILTAKTEPEFSAMFTFLETFLQVFKESIPQIVYPLTKSIITHLDELNIVEENELVILLLSSLEKLLLGNFKHLYDAKNGHFTPFEDEESPSGGGSSLIGNVINGVFSVESPSDRSAIQNGKVLLYEAIDMAIAKCCKYWEFLEQARTQTTYSTTLFVTGRLKTRLRKLSAMLYRYQPIETIKLVTLYSANIKTAVRFVHMFEGMRYKHTVQVLFESLTSVNEHSYQNELTPQQLFSFLEYYIESLESDVVEDVWNMLMNFFNEVHSKTSQFKPVLLNILRLYDVINHKLSSSTFGQGKKLRKDFGDHYLKTLTLVLTECDVGEIVGSPGFLTAIDAVSRIVQDNDKQISILTKVLNTVFVPNSKSPKPEFYQVFALVVRNSPTTRVWKQTFVDLFFDSQFFDLSVEQAKLLMPVVEKWIQIDKERVNEFLSRLANYGSNSVLFVWSSSGTLTDNNLCRLAFMCLCVDQPLPVNYTKIVNQMSAVWSGKESIPKLCILMKALTLAGANLSTIYTFVTFKLQALFHEFLSALAHKNSDVKSDPKALNIILQASKLLDFVLTLDSDQFQYYEWLFICDSPDAIYPRQNEERTGDVLDKLASERQLSSLGEPTQTLANAPEAPKGVRKPILGFESGVGDLSMFYHQASISLYEKMYALEVVDKDYLRGLVLRDLFES